MIRASILIVALGLAVAWGQCFDVTQYTDSSCLSPQSGSAYTGTYCKNSCGVNQAQATPTSSAIVNGPSPGGQYDIIVCSGGTSCFGNCIGGEMTPGQCTRVLTQGGTTYFLASTGTPSGATHWTPGLVFLLPLVWRIL